jgi:type IV secretion system protein TrbI
MSSTEGEVAQPCQKIDAERLELRARPRPVVRFRRGAIIGLAAVVAAFIAGIALLALEPTSFKIAPPALGGEQRNLHADALEGVPENYGDVPLLGPPLPGDLGRPIVKRLQALEDRAEPGSEPVRRDGDRLSAARSSALMVRLSAPPTNDGAKPVEGQGEADGPVSGNTAILSAGTIIAASLITGLNSDLPGIVLAQVTEPVRDSVTGSQLLIPQGARLVGEYDNRIAYGQRRALLSWTKLVFPDGRTIELDKLPAADRTGHSGLEDEVDFHGWRLLKGIGLSTAIDIGSELFLGDSETGLVRALREAGQQSTARAGDEITKRNLDVKPTITVRPGWPVRIILDRDLMLPAWME